MNGWSSRNRISNDSINVVLGPLSLHRILILQRRFDQLQIPITVFVPDELIEMAGRVIEPILFQGGYRISDSLIQPAQDPPVGKRPLCFSRRRIVVGPLHASEGTVRHSKFCWQSYDNLRYAPPRA